MLEKGPVVVVDWLRRRGERRAMLMAVEELNQSRDEMLSDIGITRDELMFASRLLLGETARSLGTTRSQTETFGRVIERPIGAEVVQGGNARVDNCDVTGVPYYGRVPLL